MADLMQLSLDRQREILREAENDRLADQLPRRHSVARHAVAQACQRLAKWLDTSNGYVRPAQTGLADWAAQPTSAYIWLADSVTPPAARDYKTRPTDQLLLR
jgi:hypothetical protein